MKNAKWMLPVVLMLMTGLMTAQSLKQTQVVAQVPFNFIVGDRMIPAGECTVKSAGTTMDTLLVSNFDAAKSALISSYRQDTSDTENTVLVFKQYGDRYFLTSIRLEGSDRAYTLPESRAEAELRAQNVTASQTILLASLR
jgi:hypothetical protein